MRNILISILLALATTLHAAEHNIPFTVAIVPSRSSEVTKKRNEGFTRNLTGTFLVPPGESQVYTVGLDTEWDNRPTFADSGDTSVTVKAIYEVTPTTESTKYGVWTGCIESSSCKFFLTHW